MCLKLSAAKNALGIKRSFFNSIVVNYMLLEWIENRGIYITLLLKAAGNDVVFCQYRLHESMSSDIIQRLKVLYYNWRMSHTI